VNDLEEKLKCAFSDIGAQVGDLVRCMVAAEVAAHVARIQQLQAVLNGTACSNDVNPPA
jgi:hypothetical protein